jgi:hypothetical protein
MISTLDSRLSYSFTLDPSSEPNALGLELVRSLMRSDATKYGEQVRPQFGT